MEIFNLSPFVKIQFEIYPALHEMSDNELDLQSDWELFQLQNSNLDVFSLLRNYRQSRLALIATQDLKHFDLLKTLRLTSQLARLLIRKAYEYALTEHEEKFGQIINNGETAKLIIFALGKLGGNELNYSSDVDLVFCYTANGESNGRKCIDAQSYFQRLGQRIIQILETTTTDGIVYRVDMRLRPFGSASPLVCTTDYLIHYLESEGRDWERYAWLRASCIAGDIESGGKTIHSIQPFIYRKYLDYNVYESLRQIKQQIIRKQFEDLDNIKLGRGGIREIEFIVQTLQLTFAGRNQQLRGNDLWFQLQQLKQYKHLNSEEFEKLSNAWMFLRRLENLCQIINDTSTHHLPNDQQTLALSLNLKNSDDLLRELRTHRANVNEVFQQLFSEKNNKPTTNKPEIQKIKDQVAEKNFPKSIKHKIYDTWDAMSQLLTPFNRQDAIIERFQKIINAISKRSSYLSMLIESPLILEKLLHQISQSHYFSDSIAKNPMLLESLFHTIDNNDFHISEQWDLLIRKQKSQDEEQFHELLCQFKQMIQFKTVSAFFDEIINTVQASKILTHLAEFILKKVIEQSWQQTQKRRPSSVCNNDLIAIAYGSLAVGNMHLNSDFDIVFISQNELSGEDYRFVIRWIKRIINMLSLPTYYGSLYQIDMQLRPNGNSGTAVVTKSGFEDYQFNQAWLWEHAALIKSRAVYATNEQKIWFDSIREKIIRLKRDPKEVDKQLNEMSEKLKLQGNKNHEKEFEVLGEILKKAHNQPEVINSIFDQTDNNLKFEASINRHE